MHHSFDIEIAKEYGIEAAIILANLAFWTTKDIANNHNFFDGLHWIYNSVEAWQELFPYMTNYSIRNSLKKLEELGIIKAGNYCENTYNRTKWYALTEFGKCICRIQQMELSKPKNGVGENDKSYNKTVINTVLKPLSTPISPPKGADEMEPIVKKQSGQEHDILNLRDVTEEEKQSVIENAFATWQQIAKESDIEFTESEWQCIYGYVIAKPKLQPHQITARIYQLDKWANEGLDIINSLLKSQDTKVLLDPKMCIEYDDRGNRIYGQQIVEKRNRIIQKERELK